MVKPVREEDSSSLNAKISDNNQNRHYTIKTEIGLPDILRIEDDVGGFFFTRLEYLHIEIKDIIKESSIGMKSVSVKLIDGREKIFENAQEALKAEKHALSFLARSEHSRYLLNRKLSIRGYNSISVEMALNRLEKLGILNDERYANEWAENRIKRTCSGPGKIIALLRVRGINEKLAIQTVEKLYGEAEKEQIMNRFVKKVVRGKKIEMDKMRSVLLKQGFRKTEIDRAFLRLILERA